MIDALRRFTPSFLQRRVSASTRSTLNLLLRCRTPALGGHRYECDDCGYSAVLYNSCGNRHCPQCQGPRRRRWVETQQALLLPVPHFQVVFTLPSELRPIVLQFPRQVYDVLLKASYGALEKLAATKWHATPAVLAVLHTWARDLSFHPHVHCVIAAGGMTDDGGWVTVSNDFLFHVRPLQRLFRGLFLDGLRALRLDLNTTQRIRLRNARRKAAFKNWNVYVEAPKGRDPALMVKYLARYVYQAAISDHRIVAIDKDTVTIRTHGTERVALPGMEFARRLSQHFLPTGFRRVRHYGLLAPGARRRLEQARAITLHQRVEEPVRDEPASATVTIGTHRNACPVCDALLRVFIVPPDPTGWPRGPP